MRAFTLIEILVVIAIIAVLAAMIGAAALLGDTTAQETACRNNLKQIGNALTNWQAQKGGGNDSFPGKLQWLSDEEKGLSDLAGDHHLYRCPLDDADGIDPDMGRPTAWNSGWSAAQSPFEPGSSYLYEMSQAPCPYQAGVSWATWKRWQHAFGNGTASYPDYSNGKAFPGSRMPIVRCFHHHDWESVAVSDNVQRVFNLSWGMNVFTSRPQWELDVAQ